MKPLIIGAGVGTAALITLVAETDPISIPTFANSGQVILAVIMLIQLGLRVWDKREERKWKLEDRAIQLAERAEVRRKLEDEARAVKEELRTTKRTLSLNTSEIKAELAKNTDLTKEVGHKADMAYEVSNNVNEKIEAVGGMRRRVPPNEERRKTEDTE
jgi:hypothetical protein